MGANLNIDIDKFPKQAGPNDFAPVGTRVNICFHFDLSKLTGGKIIRHDIEEPGLLIFQLDDGRVVLATECMWSLSKDTMQ